MRAGQGEFPGFETALLKDVRVRSGENRQVVVLPIQLFWSDSSSQSATEAPTFRVNDAFRNSLRASRQKTINLQAAYQFAFGRTRTALPPGIGVFGGGGAAEVRTFDQGNARYRLQLFVQDQNLTNQANYVGYSGTFDLAVLRAADDGPGDAQG